MIKYPVAAPDLSGNEARYVQECVESTWISSAGKFLNQFEAGIAQYTQTQHAIACSNGTVALHLALHVLDLKPGDEVIVPSLTYVASANAVTYCGATVVFADSQPDSWCLCPKSVERMITPRTVGIMPVHLYGHPCDMDELMAIAHKHDLWVIEDCAESLGATYKGKPTGSFGEAGVFSFFGNKTITTGEGGAIITNDDAYNHRLRHFRGQGMDPNRRYWHTVVGFNYRMTNLAAAIGVAQLERIEDLVGARRRIAQRYTENLSTDSRITLQVEKSDVVSSFWMYSVLVESPAMRDAVMKEMANFGIETRPIFYPVHHFPIYNNARTDRDCPVACDVGLRGISLPSSAYLTDSDIDFIASRLSMAIDRVQVPASVRRAA